MSETDIVNRLIAYAEELRLRGRGQTALLIEEAVQTIIDLRLEMQA